MTEQSMNAAVLATLPGTAGGLLGTGGTGVAALLAAGTLLLTGLLSGRLPASATAFGLAWGATALAGTAVRELSGHPETAEMIGALVLLMVPGAMLAQVWAAWNPPGRSAGAMLAPGALVGIAAAAAITRIPLWLVAAHALATTLVWWFETHRTAYPRFLRLLAGVMWGWLGMALLKETVVSDDAAAVTAGIGMHVLAGMGVTTTAQWELRRSNAAANEPEAGPRTEKGQ